MVRCKLCTGRRRVLINPRARPCDEQVIRSARGAAHCTASQRRWVLVATILASVIAYIDESVVNVALPVISKDLATSVAVIQWVINAYTLCLAAFLLVGGAAGDQLGRRRVFVIGIAIFAIASVWCALSPNVTQLIIARAIQGIGAALLIPCSLAIIGASFPEAERGIAIGTWAGFSAIAAAIGPLLGGWIVDHFTWQAIFLINPFPGGARHLDCLASSAGELRSRSAAGYRLARRPVGFRGSGWRRIRIDCSPRQGCVGCVGPRLLGRRPALSLGVRMARRPN